MRGEIGIAPFIEQICMKRADRIAADSEFTKRDIVKTYGTPETSIGIIYLGVNPEDYYRAQRW